MRVRIEANEDGELYFLLPDEILEEFQLEVGDTITWSLQEEDIVLLEF